MEIKQTNISGCKIIEPIEYKDNRGFFLETFQKNRYKDLAGIDSCSWYEFSKKILYHLDLKNKNQISIKKIKTKDLSLNARRPKNSSLDCKKFYEVFNFTHSDLDQCIIRCIDKLKV